MLYLDYSYHYIYLKQISSCYFILLFYSILNINLSFFAIYFQTSFEGYKKKRNFATVFEKRFSSSAGRAHPF